MDSKTDGSEDGLEGELYKASSLQLMTESRDGGYLDNTKNFSLKKSATNAHVSLPLNFEIKGSRVCPDKEGVFATKRIDIGACFGPYEGEKVDAVLVLDGRDVTYMWEVSYKMSPLEESNWFVFCTRSAITPGGRSL